MNTVCRSNYLTSVLDSRYIKLTIDAIKEIIDEWQLEFDTVVFRGMSGALIAPRVADKLDKELLMVRKDDNSHSPHRVEGNIATRRYIIIDDLINTGETIKAIFSALYREGHLNDRFDLREAECAGIILYHDSIDMCSRRFSFTYKGPKSVDKGVLDKVEIETMIFPFKIVKTYKGELEACKFSYHASHEEKDIDVI